MTEVFNVLVDVIVPAAKIAAFLAFCKLGVGIIFRAATGKERFL